MKEKIMDKMEDYYNRIKSDDYEVLGIFLYGSQNYDLAYEESDVDTKAIIVPNFNEFVLNKKPVSKTIEMDKKDQVDIKDIRLMFDNFLKQNINFVEILFTDYMIINPKYEKIFEPMLENKEEIARYNIYKALNCIAGMSMQKLKALEHPYPATKDKIEKYGYDPKQLHHIIRLNEFIKKYIWEYSYKDCLKSSMKDYLIGIKSHNYYDLDTARAMAKNVDRETKYIKDLYFKNNELQINESIEKLLKNVTINVFKEKFKKEIA